MTDHRYKHPDPSPEQIKRECERIQKGWDDVKRERATVGGVKRWVAPVVRALVETRDGT